MTDTFDIDKTPWGAVVRDSLRAITPDFEKIHHKGERPMTDTNINTTTPGQLGQTRSTWRDENHLRGMLLTLSRKNPDATRDELEALYLAKAKGPSFRAKPLHEALIDEALRRAFDNDLLAVQRLSAPVQRRQANAEALNTIAEQVHKTITEAIKLDMVTPNGKKLRDCTGTECIGFGKQYTKLGKHVGDRIVGQVVKSDAKVVKIVFGDAR